MSQSLFDDFPPVPAKQWKQKIQFDLKGEDYNDALVWTSNEGIQVKPFYHYEDLKNSVKATTTTSQFKICETIFVSNMSVANKRALKAIKAGAGSIKFIIPNETIATETLLQHINLNSTTIHIELGFLSEHYTDQLHKIFNETESNAAPYVHTDIIGHLAKSGNWYTNLNEDFSRFRTVTTQLKTYSVNASLYQNAGANMVQQLAYALAHANEYCNYIEHNLSKNISANIEVVFNVAVGTNYFFEIAKLRALRLLFNTLQNEYTNTYKGHIFVTPSKRNKAIYEYNTNMLRTTTECMSAILGGADTIANLPYDAIFHKDNDFGSRIARNQLLILKHESYFDKVNNPSDGSFYVETLTQQLAEKALLLFKDIEANGGFLKQLKSGTIQRKIKESALKEQAQFNTGNDVITGSNKYPNTNDTMKTNLELYPFVKTEKRKTLIVPIIEKRLTENLEQERLKKE
ncbi:methylmalonyl-CoA mutase subunit beta [Flavobacteriaceae bacterium MHTCC 0001]